MVGLKPGSLDERMRPLLAGYMTMGHTGMDMGKMVEVMPHQHPAGTVAVLRMPDGA